jgi:hypothetical protein
MRAGVHVVVLTDRRGNSKKVQAVEKGFDIPKRTLKGAATWYKNRRDTIW